MIALYMSLNPPASQPEIPCLSGYISPCQAERRCSAVEKTLDLSKTIYELCKEDPKIIPIMLQAGFSEIANPLMLATAGRVMTIPQGAKMRKISLDTVTQVFRSHGYGILFPQDES